MRETTDNVWRWLRRCLSLSLRVIIYDAIFPLETTKPTIMVGLCNASHRHTHPSLAKILIIMWYFRAAHARCSRLLKAGMCWT